MIITLNKLVISVFFLNLLKGICVKPTINITLHGEKSDAFLLWIGIR